MVSSEGHIWCVSRAPVARPPTTFAVPGSRLEYSRDDSCGVTPTGKSKISTLLAESWQRNVLVYDAWKLVFDEHYARAQWIRTYRGAENVVTWCVIF